MTRNVFFYCQQIFYWGVLLAGLVITFVSSFRIGLVTFGCFLVLYNASASSMRWKAIPLLGNSLAQLIGIVLFIVGLILSFIASRRLGFFVLAGSVVAVVILNVLLAIERSLMKKLFKSQGNIQPQPELRSEIAAARLPPRPEPPGSGYPLDSASMRKYSLNTMGLFGWQVRPHEMSNNLDELLAQLVHRKHWKKLPPDLLRRIIKNSQDEVFQDPKCDLEVIKNFILISEQTPFVQRSLLRANFVPIANDRGADWDWVLGLFSTTLYQFGSWCYKACVSAATEEEARNYAWFATAGFLSSILCDPLSLPSYGGMAFLSGEVVLNKPVAIEWCQKYKRAEDRLRNIPDDQLGYWRSAQKELLDPEKAAATMKEMAQHVPHLLPDLSDRDERSMRDQIDELEAELERRP